MKIARAAAFAALLFGMIGVAPVRGATAGLTNNTIFVTNLYDVTAYPIGSWGDVAPLALTTDMTYPSGIARDLSGRIYTTNAVTNTVTVYAANANGNVPPIAVIGGSNTGLTSPLAIALDASGQIYVLNSMFGSWASITVYPPLGTSTGVVNEAPIATIAGGFDLPAGIAVDSLGNIYVANETGGPFVPGTEDAGQITVYPPGSNGDTAPIATISGAATGLAQPLAIALDSSGNIYVANYHTANTSGNLEYDSSITVYQAGSNGDARPMAIITGSHTLLPDFPQGIVLDSSGNLYVTGGSVNVYPAGSNGNVPPAAIIKGPDTGLDGPYGIALDASGSLYVANADGGTNHLGSITIYAAGSSGDAAPLVTITSSSTGLDGASGIAVDSSGNIYVANQLAGGSVTIYSPGSYAAAAPIATIAGDKTRLYHPFGIAVDSRRNIFVLNDDKAITVYGEGSAGNVTPKATIKIDRGETNVPTGIAVDPGGDLYVANFPGIECDLGSCSQTSTANVTVYPAGSNGNAKPIAAISGPRTGLKFPRAIAVDHDGGTYVGNQGRSKCTPCGCYPTGPASVTVYSPGSNGDVAPVATISGANTGLGVPYGIALDSKQNIYTLNGGRFVVGGGGGLCVAMFRETPTPVVAFAADSYGNVAPIGTIGGAFSGLAPFLLWSGGIAIGPAGQ
ncbi:MAG TPA: hypothetical protein VEC38_14965 [Candidatus Binataceae bacterium]|nr:hypothetical protein [Candidatus Binataceae bacterium]